MRIVKAQRILVLILLIAVCSLGYWIGYISSKPTEAGNLHQQLQELVVNSIHHDEVLQSNKINVVDEPHIKHVQGIHKAHVAHIKDHLHPEIHPKTKANNTVPKKVGVKPLKEEEPGGVEWEHIQKQKEEADNPVKAKPVPVTPRMAKFDISDPFYAVIHSGVATRVHGKIHEKLQTLPDTIQKEAYIFEADKLPENPRLRPSIGNGHLGTVIHAKNVFMNGLYSGLRNTSHRAAIPSSCSFNITGTKPETNFTRKYRLNVGEGVYSEVSEGPGYTLTQRMYAHRNITPLIVVEVDLVRTKPPDAATPQSLTVKLNKWTASYDLTFNTYDSGYDKVSYKVGRINAPELLDQTYSEAHVLYDRVPDKLEILAQTPRIKWVFLTAIGHTKEQAFQAYKQGSSLLKQHDALYAQHVEAWAQVWNRGRVDVVGNMQIARAVYGSWYYILSSMPVTPHTGGYSTPEEEFVGLSPTGLPYGDEDDDYMGHVFWDQETWMYPPILLLRPDLAHMLLLTRKRTQAAAAQYAKDTGFQGLRYPWESARLGIDVTPDQNCSQYELHINGDISLAIVQYLYATNDTSIIQGSEHFDEVIAGIANFWVSKLWQNPETSQYEIHDVMPPDEDCIKVDNSVYTNEVARIALKAPEYVFSLLDKKETHWKDFPDNIYMPFDKKHDYHPEYDGYKYGSTVKQADAVMLGYPLQRKMPQEVRVNDLKTYAKVTDKHGPAMTWPMYCIGWLEVKDLKQAEEVFMKSFDYIHTEFQVWTEVLAGPDSGATNFLTGMGGFLQSIMFGYGGFRLRQDRLDLDPELPPQSMELHIIGLAYRGNTMDVFATEENVMVSVTARAKDAAVLHLQEYKSGAIHDLNLKVPVTVKRQKCTIFKE